MHEWITPTQEKPNHSTTKENIRFTTKKRNNNKSNIANQPIDATNERNQTKSNIANQRIDDIAKVPKNEHHALHTTPQPAQTKKFNLLFFLRRNHQPSSLAFFDKNRALQDAKLQASAYLHAILQHSKNTDTDLIQTEMLRVKKSPSLFARKFYNHPGVLHQSPKSILAKLKNNHQLSDYLKDSFAYIYLRDLGSDLKNPTDTKRIEEAVKYSQYLVENFLAHKQDASKQALFAFFQKTQKLDLAEPIVEVIEKIKNLRSQLPQNMSFQQTSHKIIKVVMGVVLQQFHELKPTESPLVRTQKMKKAITLGYAYGITYPFVDDLLDTKNILTKEERDLFSAILEQTLVTGKIPEPTALKSSKNSFLHFVYQELKQAFQTIDIHQPTELRKNFFEQAYIFFHAQDASRIQDLNNPAYHEPDLYIPSILKSSSARITARSVLGANIDPIFKERMFALGLMNQMHDDMQDFKEDLASETVTPFTYYYRHHKQRCDLENPLNIYFAVISHLFQDVYPDNPEAKRLIAQRVIHHRQKILQLNKDDFKQWSHTFETPSVQKNFQKIDLLCQKGNTSPFLDHVFHQLVGEFFATHQKNHNEFLTTFHLLSKNLQGILPISKEASDTLTNTDLVAGANYSLEAGGKRIRPILAQAVGVMGYGLKEKNLIPLLRSIEYMHTASLIFDDLPAQDNANLRRGRPTLHVHLKDAAAAELTGLFLVLKATEEQSSLHGFPAKKIQQLIHYSAQVTQDMCKGQRMDLQSKKVPLDLNELETLCYYKTGIAIEASLLMPAILANAPKKEREALSRFAKHAGIAFQIKDDLLDVEGDKEKVGKDLGLDFKNQQSTFVTLLGVSKAKEYLYQHYLQAFSSLSNLSFDTQFLQQVLHFIVHRTH